MIYLGLDDTDVAGGMSGTGKVARVVAGRLAASFRVAGIVRHQLLNHDQIAATAKNSAASILIDSPADDATIEQIASSALELMFQHFEAGSDPGLVVARDEQFSAELLAFGRRCQQEVVTQREAWALAEAHELWIHGLGGTQDGVIGALAAVALAHGGEDGRYIQVGRIRQLTAWCSVDQVLAAGVAVVQTTDGTVLKSGLIQADRLRPARRGGQAVLFVEQDAEGHWLPLKLD